MAQTGPAPASPATADESASAGAAVSASATADAAAPGTGTGASAVPPPAGSALVRAILAQLGSDPEAPAFALPDAFGGWFEMTAGEFLPRARALASGLIATGLESGEVLAVLCSDRFELALIDVAAAMARVTVLPVSPAATASGLLATLESAGARAVIVETVRDFARFDEVHGDLPLVAEAWQIGLGDLDKLAELGAELPEGRLDERVAGGSDDDVATLLDDGACGLVPVTHAVLLARVAALAEAVGGPAIGGDAASDAATAGAVPAAGDDASADPSDPGADSESEGTPVDPGSPLGTGADTAGPVGPDEHDSAPVAPSALGGTDPALLQILPATDPTGRVATMLAVVSGTRLGFLAEGADLIAALASFRPTLVVGRPDTFARVEAATLARAEQTSRGPALKQALEVAAAHSAALEAGSVARGLRARFVLADALVLRGLRKAVGGRVQVVVSLAGDEVLPTRLRHLMRALDVRPLEGLGLAATGGPALIERWNAPFDRPEGTVGEAVAGVEVDVAADGSVSVRSAVPAPADDEPESGWIDTGLTGELVDGRLTLTPPAPSAGDSSESTGVTDAGTGTGARAGDASRA